MMLTVSVVVLLVTIIDGGRVDGTAANISMAVATDSTVNLTCFSHSPSAMRWNYHSPDGILRVVYAGNNINSALRDRYTVVLDVSAGRSDLVIRSVQDSDSGTFTCSEWNTMAWSKKFLLTVEGPSNIVTTPRYNVDARQTAFDSVVILTAFVTDLPEEKKMMVLMMSTILSLVGLLALAIIVVVVVFVKVARRRRNVKAAALQVDYVNSQWASTSTPSQPPLATQPANQPECSRTTTNRLADADDVYLEIGDPMDNLPIPEGYSLEALHAAASLESMVNQYDGLNPSGITVRLPSVYERVQSQTIRADVTIEKRVLRDEATQVSA